MNFIIFDNDDDFNGREVDCDGGSGVEVDGGACEGEDDCGDSRGEVNGGGHGSENDVGGCGDQVDGGGSDI